MATDKRHDWRALCKAVSVEQDSERLSDLLAELLKTMDMDDMNKDEFGARQPGIQQTPGLAVQPRRNLRLSLP
jgi:hypothetical protein